jgi:hypothetical protein
MVGQYLLVLDVVSLEVYSHGAERTDLQGSWPATLLDCSLEDRYVGFRELQQYLAADPVNEHIYKLY